MRKHRLENIGHLSLDPGVRLLVLASLVAVQARFNTMNSVTFVVRRPVDMHGAMNNHLRVRGTGDCALKLASPIRLPFDIGGRLQLSASSAIISCRHIARAALSSATSPRVTLGWIEVGRPGWIRVLQDDCMALLCFAVFPVSDNAHMRFFCRKQGR